MMHKSFSGEAGKEKCVPFPKKEWNAGRWYTEINSYLTVFSL
jgi:hypothetical protein